MQDLNEFRKTEIITIPLEKKQKTTLKNIIKRINSLYEKKKLQFKVHDSTYEILKSSPDFTAISNFFFYPTSVIYEFDGEVEKHIGYRLRLIKRKKNSDEIKIFNINLLNRELEKTKWLEDVASKGFKLNVDEIDYHNLLQSTFNSKFAPRYVLTTAIGWVQGKTTYQYVPISTFDIDDNDDVFYRRHLPRNLKHVTIQSMSDSESFLKMWELLSVTDKAITIPLLSFTIVSTLYSLIKRNNQEHPRFMICLHGDNRKHYKEALSNMFCNIYNRSQNIYVLNSTLHANNCMKFEIPAKALKMRDAVFIGRIERKNDLKTYINLLNRTNLSNGILLISDVEIRHDSVITLDVSNCAFDTEIFKFHKSNPTVFSTWLSSFIRHIQSSLEDPHWGLGKKQNMDKFYETCIKMITKKNANFDTNKLTHLGWLLLGYCLFIHHGSAVMREYDNEFLERIWNSTNEAIDIFRTFSCLDIHEDDIGVPQLSPIQADSLSFVHAIDKLLTDESVSTDKASEPELGWILDNTLHLKNKIVFSMVQKYLKENDISFGSNRKNIYRHLFEIGVICEKATNSWGLNLKSNTRTVRYDIQKMKCFLIDSGYKLHFLCDK